MSFECLNVLHTGRKERGVLWVGSILAVAILPSGQDKKTIALVLYTPGYKNKKHRPWSV